MTARRKPRRRATAGEIQAMIQMRLNHASWEQIGRRHGFATGSSARTTIVRFVTAAGDELLLQAMRGRYAYRRRAYLHWGGYMRTWLPDHPLADRMGMVREHRRVLFDAIGPGSHPCSQCGRVLDWEAIVVDHINRVRADNRLENLRVCCLACNAGLQWRSDAA